MGASKPLWAMFVSVTFVGQMVASIAVVPLRAM